MIHTAPPSEYGAWLKEQREALSYTQKEMAAALGISHRSLQDYEAGNAKPRPTRRRVLTQAVIALSKEQAA